MEIDAYLDITYNLNTDKFTLDGNVNEEYHAELLENYLQDECYGNVGEMYNIGGKTTEEALGTSVEANEKDIYHIIIGLTISGDTYSVACNTGDRGLRVGIVMNLLGQLSKKKKGE